jgi:preprotein translocase subunit YajC
VHAANLSFFQNVAPKTGATGAAQESVPQGAPPGAGPQAAAPSPLSMLAPFLILLPFIWMMFRRQKKEQAERAKLKKGDKVATQSGLVGELMDMGDPTSKLKIAAGVTVEVLTSSLQVFPTASAKKDDVKVDAKVAAEKK